MNLCVSSLGKYFRAVSIIVRHCELSVTVFCGLLSYIVIIVSYYHCLLSTWTWLTFVIPILFTRYSTAPCSIESWYFLDTKHLYYLSWCCHLCCVQLFLRPQPVRYREYGPAYQPQRLLTSWLAWQPVCYLINNTGLLYKVMSYKGIFNMAYSHLCRCIYLLYLLCIRDTEEWLPSWGSWMQVDSFLLWTLNASTIV